MATTSLFKQQWYFRYDPIDKSHDSFRAAKLLPAPYSAPVECILSHERISALEGRYCALSYTWGERASQRWIRLNGMPFMIQPNLFGALKTIRKEDEEIFLWADGVCINQADTAERNHQVGLMGNIYRSAKNIRIWLGPAGEESDVVLDYVERDSDRFRREKAGETLEEIPEFEEKAFLDAFRALHRRPYWGRAWIKQEVILARELVIHCGTKSVDGFRLLLLAHWHCFMADGLSDEIANLSVHRFNLGQGKLEPLEILLKRYGRTGCTDPRDRVFSVLSIASDCKGLEAAIADYSVSTPALFFGLLGFIKPQNVISLATSLHEILAVRRAQLFEYWDKIQVFELRTPRPPPATHNKLENVGISLIWSVKVMKKILEEVKELHPAYVESLKLSFGRDFASICQLMSLEPFLVHSCLMMDSDLEPEEKSQVKFKKEDYALFRISDTDLFIITRRTFLGLRFEYIYRKLDDPSSEKQFLFDPIVSCMNSEELKPFMIYPRIMLQRMSMMPSVETIIPNIINKGLLKKTFEIAVVEPPLEVICCILLEFDRLSGSRRICVNDCRYVLEEFGYEIIPLGIQLAEFRIQAEHEEYYGNAPRRRRQLQYQTQVTNQ